jgi:hypothetical protein
LKVLITFFLLIILSLQAEARIRRKTYSGSLDLTTYTFSEKSNSDNLGSESVVEGTLHLKYQKKINNNVGLILDPYLDFSEYQNSKGDKFYLRAKNTGLFLKHKKTTFTAGLLSHSFGLSQLFSPLNFVDTASYWSPLAAQTISSPTLRAMYKTKKIRAFVSWLPRRFENIYPGNDSSWLPNQAPGALVSEGRTFLFPSTVDYQIDGKQDVDGALRDNFVAGLRLEQGPVLSQVLYYRGVDSDPTLDLNLDLTTVDATPGNEVLQVENPVRATPVYQTVERMGLSIRYTLPIKWRLLYEGNLSKGIANDRQGYRESQTHTGGLEWGIPVGKTLILGVVQLYRSRNSNSSSLGFVSPFRKAYLVGASWDYKKLSLSGGYFNSQSLKITLKTLAMSYKLKKNFKLTLNGTFIDGELAELLSGVLDLDTVGLKASYTF